MLLTTAVEELRTRLAVARRRSTAAAVPQSWRELETIRGAHLDELIESAPEGIAVTDPGCRVLRVNGEFTRIFGCTAEEAVGRRIDELVAPADRLREAEALTHAVLRGERVGLETVRRRRDGTLFHASVLAIPIRVEGRHIGNYGIYRDITKRKLTEAALRASEQRYRALFDQSPIGVFQYDRELRITTCNERLLEILQIPREELIGRRLERMRDPRILPAIRRALAGRVSSYEGAYTTTTRGMELWISMRISPLRSPHGEVVGGIGAVEDITERKRAQAALAQLNDELRRRTREVEAVMLSRNRLYVSMNHELRTPISAIMLYNELLLGGTLGPLREEQVEAVQHAQKAAGHLMELVHDVLDLSKIEAGKVELQLSETSLPELLDDLLSTAQPLATQNGVTLDIEVGNIPPW